MIHLFNQDCMEAMASMKDNEFDLAIVDPPYSMFEFGMQKGGNNHIKGSFNRNKIDWDISPNQHYFDELRRVSKQQIIWGGNYFTDKLPVSREWICWDKLQYMPTFSRFELAWTSYKSVMKMCSETSITGNRIHPTQKPVALYTWLLDKYAQQGWKILDTHLGSGSSAIAAHDMGFEFHGYELDEEYFEAASKRLKLHQQQMKLF